MGQEFKKLVKKWFDLAIMSNISQNIALDFVIQFVFIWLLKEYNLLSDNYFCFEKNYFQSKIKPLFKALSDNSFIDLPNLQLNFSSFENSDFIDDLFFLDKIGLVNILNKYGKINSSENIIDNNLLSNFTEVLISSYKTEDKNNLQDITGSFYTPYEIVKYMVQQSIMYHLLNHISGVKEKEINNFLTIEDYNLIDNEIKKKIITSISDIKILDPAVGCGIFPLVMLEQLTNIWQKCDKNIDRGNIKLHLIENCIYGVDILAIVVEVSKLRLYLSLLKENKIIPFSSIKFNFEVKNFLLDF